MPDIFVAVSPVILPFARILPAKVDIPAATSIPPAVILTPFLAVISPTASIFVTSSYVNVPAILTFPANEALLVNVANPATVRSSNCVSPFTSKVEFISTALLKVETPATTNSSASI